VAGVDAVVATAGADGIAACVGLDRVIAAGGGDGVVAVTGDDAGRDVERAVDGIISRAALKVERRNVVQWIGSDGAVAGEYCVGAALRERDRVHALASGDDEGA